MTSPHLDHDTTAQEFGEVRLTVDLEAGDCVITAPQHGPVFKRPVTKRLNSLDEIQLAYQNQLPLGREGRDICRALKFAATLIHNHQRDSRNV